MDVYPTLAHIEDLKKLPPQTSQCRLEVFIEVLHRFDSLVLREAPAQPLFRAVKALANSTRTVEPASVANHSPIRSFYSFLSRFFLLFYFRMGFDSLGWQHFVTLNIAPHGQ